jgi:hypothetical protein
MINNQLNVQNQFSEEGYMYNNAPYMNEPQEYMYDQPQNEYPGDNQGYYEE